MKNNIIKDIAESHDIPYQKVSEIINDYFVGCVVACIYKSEIETNLGKLSIDGDKLVLGETPEKIKNLIKGNFDRKDLEEATSEMIKSSGLF